MGRAEHRRELLEHLPRGGIGMEIGVWDGGFSEEILKIARPRTLHLVDPWTYQPEFANAAFGKPKNERAMEDRFRAVSEKFARDDRVVIHRAMSHEVLAGFADGALDWVYLDGNHNYDVVRGDLALCRAKVRPGGIISGDDLLWKLDDGAPVRRAVREFRREIGKDNHAFVKFGQQWMLTLPA